MTSLIEFIIDLFRFPAVASSFVANPEQTMRDAGLAGVSSAQLASVAASAVPAGVVLGGGDPVVGLQNAVSDYYSMSSPFSPQTGFVSQPTFAPNTDFASGNNMPVASGNNIPVMSPDQHAGANAQQGAFNLGFGDITLGGSLTSTLGTFISTVADGPSAVAFNKNSAVLANASAILERWQNNGTTRMTLLANGTLKATSSTGGVTLDVSGGNATYNIQPSTASLRMLNSSSSGWIPISASVVGVTTRVAFGSIPEGGTLDTGIEREIGRAHV